MDSTIIMENATQEAINEKDIALYEKLAELSDMESDLYGSEYCDEWIMEYLPESEWAKAKSDFVKMKLAEGQFTEMFDSFKVPESEEACAQMIDAFSYDMLTKYFKGYSDAEQQGMMIQMLANAADMRGKSIEATELVEMANAPAEKLEQQTVDTIKEFSLEMLKNTDVEKLKEGMDCIISDVTDLQNVLNGKKLSVSALSIAAYLTNPKMRKAPELISASAVASKKIADTMEHLQLPEGMEISTLIEMAEAGEIPWYKNEEFWEDFGEIVVSIFLFIIWIMIILLFVSLFAFEESPVMLEIMCEICLFVGVGASVLAAGILAAGMIYVAGTEMYKFTENSNDELVYIDETEDEDEDEDEDEAEYEDE